MNQKCVCCPWGFQGNVLIKRRWGTVSSLLPCGVRTSNASFMVTSLDVLAMFLLIQLWLQLTFAARLHGWLLFHWLFPRTPGPFLQSCFPAPACPVVWDCPCQRQGLPLNFMRFLPSRFSSLSGSICLTALSSSVLAAPPGLVSSMNLARACSVPSSQSLIC